MRGSRTLRAAMIAAALTFGVAPSVAWAQDKAALAEQLFSEGLAAMKAERWAAACDAFLGSNQADPSAGTEINLGVCNEKQKKYATALAMYDAAYRRATDSNPPRADKAKIAKTEYDRLLPMVHKLKVTVAKPVEGASIARNGEKLPAGAYLSAETKLDPGKYTFELTARGKKPITKEVSIPESPGTTTLDFPAMEDAPVDKANPGGEQGAGGGNTIVVNDGSSQRTVGIIVGSAGILALLAAGGLQILANNENDKSAAFRAQADPLREDAKSNPSVKTQVDELDGAANTRKDAAKNNQLIAIITGAGGVVLLGVGVVLFLTAPKSTTASGKPRILPAVGPGYAGASFGFSF